MLLRKRGQQRIHLPARLRFESPLFRPLVGGYDIRYFGHGIRFVTGGVAMSVGDFVGGDAVHECHERSALILITRQGCHDGQTNLLRDVVRGELAAFGRPDPRTAIPHHKGADALEYLG